MSRLRSHFNSSNQRLWSLLLVGFWASAQAGFAFDSLRETHGYCVEHGGAEMHLALAGKTFNASDMSEFVKAKGAVKAKTSQKVEHDHCDSASSLEEAKQKPIITDAIFPPEAFAAIIRTQKTSFLRQLLPFLYAPKHSPPIIADV